MQPKPTIDWARMESNARISRSCSADVSRKRKQGIEPSIAIQTSKHPPSDVRKFAVGVSDEGDMVQRAIEVFKATGRPTSEMLRVHMNMGGAQAIRLMDKLEYLGVVSPLGSNRKRTLLVGGDK